MESVPDPCTNKTNETIILGPLIHEFIIPELAPKRMVPIKWECLNFELYSFIY